LTGVDLSIGTKRTPQQDMKSNNTAQDDERHNAIRVDEIRKKPQEKT